MKKLSRGEMKNVMGGYPQQDHWCEVRCCLTPSGEGCDYQGTQAVYTSDTCASGSTMCSLGGGIVLNCTCYNGPWEA